MRQIVFFVAQLVILKSLSAQLPAHLIIAPGSLSESSVALLWEKQANAESYEVFLNGKRVMATAKTNVVLKALSPETEYTAAVGAKGGKIFTGELRFTTASEGRVFNILDFGARDAPEFNNTKSIQAAIDACSPGGTVYIPRGSFVSGAIFLKSNMTLFIEKGGVLQGSREVADYLPMIMNRFEGWELKTYASLINAGTLDRNGGYVVQNLRITGGGTIRGGGKVLGDAMIKAGGLRSRGRLICLMNCRDVCISNLTITEPPCWTIHYIYSNKISCHDLNIMTYGIRNGDGIDPDSSTDSYIFNCSFDTGDDCIAIKSGKNPEGFFVGRPTTNVRITDCDFRRGHGISIGSEMSGGVSDVLVQDCSAGALLNGMQIKATKDRGGYVKNVKVADCRLQRITVFSSVNYNNDGEPAPEVPVFENFTFRNIDMRGADTKDPVININGFEKKGHQLKHVVFENIVLPDGARIFIDHARDIRFEHVRTGNGSQAEFLVSNSEQVHY